MLQEVFSVSALAGAGKTFKTIRVNTAGTRAGEKYIHCVPTTDLAIQVGADYLAAGCAPVTAIHSDDGDGESVVARLTRHFQAATPDGAGEVVVMTLAALERLKYIERRSAWHLIVDELPSPIFHQSVSLHENRDRLLELFCETPWNAGYTMVSANEDETGRVIDRARNRFADQITQQTAEVANKLLSEHWNCFVLNDQLARFKAPSDHPNVMDVFALLQPSIFAGFKSVTLMGACLEESLLYRHWLALGIKFVPHPAIKPRFTQYPNGGLVTIQYAIGRDWSAKLRDTAGVMENIISRCKNAIGEEPFVYLINKDKAYDGLMTGVQLPHNSLGLNNFGHIHNAMLLSALNPPPSYFGFCSDLVGLSGDEVRTAIYRTSVYQAAMRINRDFTKLDAKRIQVVDHSTAIWLGNLIANSKIEKLPGHDPACEDRRRVEVPKTDAQRALAYKTGKKAELIAELDLVNDQKSGSHDILYSKDTVTPKMPQNDVPHVGNLFYSIGDQYGISTRGISVPSLRGLMAEAHLQVIGKKADRCLISPGSYNPNLSADTKRGNENLVNMSGVWLDNDGGDLTHDEFAKMLKVPLVIFNSFNSTVDQPRWRVWIPTACLITPAVHRELIAQITKMLIRRGFYGKKYIDKNPDRQVKHHGFDEGKFAPASLFYMPSQAAAGPDASFFLEYNWDHKPLNPYQWVDRTMVDHRAPPEPPAVQPPSNEPQTINEVKIAKANDNWQTHAPGDGNKAFFTLAVTYHHAGLSWYDAEPMLRAQAQWSHGSKSTSERLKDMKRYRHKIWHS